MFQTFTQRHNRYVGMKVVQLCHPEIVLNMKILASRFSLASLFYCHRKIKTKTASRHNLVGIQV